MAKVILIPGNGGGSAKDNWFPYIKQHLEKLGATVIAKDFPDPILAREKYWLPFIKKLGADENTILIGHSSGAIAAMRYAEKNKILGSVLVGTYYTDLGLEDEKKAGYFDRPWDWDKIRKNQQWIVQFNSRDDPWIPIEEARYVHNKLKTEYYEYKRMGHFGEDRNYKEFPKLVSILKKKLKRAVTLQNKK